MRALCIGGSSHCGKSTLALAIAERRGWRVLSTDSLARHPGRPWPVGDRPVPIHVADHYASLSVAELIDSVLAHYGRLWPRIESIVSENAVDDSSGGLVVEGSALWPDSVATLQPGAVQSLFLTAKPGCFEQRIRRNAGYALANERGRALIDKFVARTQRFDERMMESVKRLGLAHIVIDESETPDELLERCLRAG